MASASAASWDAGSAFGSSTPIIIRTCVLSPWPAPTMLFFTRFGAYSATGTPALAGTTMAMPRAWPSLSVALRVLVDEGRLDGGLVGPEFVENAHQPVMDGEKPHGERIAIVGRHRAAADKVKPIAGNLDHAPAGAAEPGIDAENANRAGHGVRLIACRQCLGPLAGRAAP